MLHDLVRTADALASNLRGDVPAKLGLVYDRLKEANPKIVCAHLSAYGRSGPRADWPGFDYLMQAEAGYFSLTGEPGAPPARFGLSIVDLMTGLGLAYALLAALTAARATGAGRDIDVSLFDMALFNTAYLATWYLNEGVVTGRLPRSAHPALTPCQLYRTRDGWIYLMCNKEKFWPALCEKLGRPEWIEDARFRLFPDRLRHRDLLTEMLDRELQQRTTAEWLALFAGRRAGGADQRSGAGAREPVRDGARPVADAPAPAEGVLPHGGIPGTVRGRAAAGASGAGARRAHGRAAAGARL